MAEATDVFYHVVIENLIHNLSLELLEREEEPPLEGINDALLQDIKRKWTERLHAANPFPPVIPINTSNDSLVAVNSTSFLQLPNGAATARNLSPSTRNNEAAPRTTPIALHKATERQIRAVKAFSSHQASQVSSSLPTAAAESSNTVEETSSFETTATDLTAARSRSQERQMNGNENQQLLTARLEQQNAASLPLLNQQQQRSRNQNFIAAENELNLQQPREASQEEASRLQDSLLYNTLLNATNTAAVRHNKSVLYDNTNQQPSTTTEVDPSNGYGGLDGGEQHSLPQQRNHMDAAEQNAIMNFILREQPQLEQQLQYENGSALSQFIKVPMNSNNMYVNQRQLLEHEHTSATAAAATQYNNALHSNRVRESVQIRRSQPSKVHHQNQHSENSLPNSSLNFVEQRRLVPNTYNLPQQLNLDDQQQLLHAAHQQIAAAAHRHGWPAQAIRTFAEHDFVSQNFSQGKLINVLPERQPQQQQQQHYTVGQQQLLSNELYPENEMALRQQHEFQAQQQISNIHHFSPLQQALLREQLSYGGSNIPFAIENAASQLSNPVALDLSNRRITPLQHNTQLLFQEIPVSGSSGRINSLRGGGPGTGYKTPASSSSMASPFVVPTGKGSVRFADPTSIKSVGSTPYPNVENISDEELDEHDDDDDDFVDVPSCPPASSLGRPATNQRGGAGSESPWSVRSGQIGQGGTTPYRDTNVPISGKSRLTSHARAYAAPVKSVASENRQTGSFVRPGSPQAASIGSAQPFQTPQAVPRTQEASAGPRTPRTPRHKLICVRRRDGSKGKRMIDARRLEDERLGSDDDLSEEEDEEAEVDAYEKDVPTTENTNVVICLFEKISRNRRRWKLHLKCGIISIEGYDYVFFKGIGEAEF